MRIFSIKISGKNLVRFFFMGWIGAEKKMCKKNIAGSNMRKGGHWP